LPAGGSPGVSATATAATAAAGGKAQCIGGSICAACVSGGNVGWGGTSTA